ncbi:hypothetical protein HUU53_01330 [Candidatus Micrarchaeota archaeon]|nr:hypothetical protein [Candidatus Micrarchaeota archaeon]
MPKTRVVEKVLPRFASHALTSLLELNPGLHSLLKKPISLKDGIGVEGISIPFSRTLKSSELTALIAHFKNHLPFENHASSSKGETGILVGGFGATGLVLRRYE